MGDDHGNGICFVIGLVFGMFIACLISTGIVNGYWKSKLLQENHAEYNIKDGSFVLKKMP